MGFTDDEVLFSVARALWLEVTPEILGVRAETDPAGIRIVFYCRPAVGPEMIDRGRRIGTEVAADFPDVSVDEVFREVERVDDIPTAEIQVFRRVKSEDDDPV